MRSSPKKTKNYEFMMRDFDPHLGLKPDEFFCFALLNNVLTNHLTLDAKENKLLSQFITSVANNREWTKRLLELNNKSNAPAAAFLLKINHKTRRLDKFIEADTNDLTLGDVGKIRDIGSLVAAFKLLPVLITENKLLSDMNEKSLRANKIFKTLVAGKGKSIFATAAESKSLRKTMQAFMNIKEKLVTESRNVSSKPSQK